jgi:phenylalanyl-tRNA synthetase beta chain
VKIETDKVTAYSLLSLRDVSVKQSTFFSRLQLIDLGHSPKNNWVDFSNLFMYLTGQPIHFFDADLIQGDVIVRQARDGELFVDLADGEHTLTADDIVIADSEKILALA